MDAQESVPARPLSGVADAGGVDLFAAVKDSPFPQDFSVQYGSAPELQGAVYQKLAVNKDGVTYLLTDKDWMGRYLKIIE